MKIAYDAKRFFQNNSGLGNYSRDLVRMLAQDFPSSTFFLLNKKRSDKGSDIQKLNNVEFVESGKGRFARQFQMGKVAQNLGVDLFHGLSGELPLRWNGKKICKVVTIHDLIFERYPNYYSFFDRKIHFWKFKQAVKSADIIVAISEQTKKDIVSFLKVPESKIEVIYQGCHQSFKTKPSLEFQEEVRKKFNLPVRFVLNVGTIEERKNLLNVLMALHETAIPLLVVGKKQKKYFSKIERYLKKNKVDVCFLEGVTMEELACIYRMADIFIYPSFFEGFGIPIIEALYSETPVIASNRSSLPEAGGPNSVYIDPANVDDIRSKLVHLWESEPERIRRAEKGLEYAQKFNDNVISRKMMDLYENLISSLY